MLIPELLFAYDKYNEKKICKNYWSFACFNDNKIFICVTIEFLEEIPINKC